MSRPVLPPKRQSNGGGFTLVEVLVALAIFAVLSALSYRSLDALLQTRQRINEESSRWREVMLFFNRFEQDVQRHANRGIRNSNTAFEPSWKANPYMNGDDDAQLALSILGNPEQPGTLMDSRRIGYRLRGGSIEQVVWPALDIAPGTRPMAYTVLHHVKTLQMRYLYTTNSAGSKPTYQWTDRWPVAASNDGETPRAVEVKVVLHTGEPLTRLIQLR